MPRPKRLSRKDKRDAILGEYLVQPPKATEFAESVSAAAPPQPPSRFQATFYKELMVCDGTFCKALKYTTTETDDALRPRIQAIGYMYNMRGGAELTPEVEKKLEEVFARVGIAYKAATPPQGQKGQTSSISTQTPQPPQKGS